MLLMKDEVIMCGVKRQHLRILVLDTTRLLVFPRQGVDEINKKDFMMFCCAKSFFVSEIDL